MNYPKSEIKGQADEICGLVTTSKNLIRFLSG